MDARDNCTSDQQLDSLQRSVADDLSQTGFFNANKGKQQNSKNNDLNETGLRRNIHGTIYQLKLLILFLQTALNENYVFKLYSEEKDAEKFDDAIFQYGKNEQYRFLQAKHKLNPEYNKITVSELSSEKSQRHFSLQKYFVSFYRIEKKERFRGKVKDVIICTNTDFSDDIKNERLIKEEEPDDILDIGGGERYKLIFDKNKDIVEKLKDISDLRKLSKKLAEMFKKDHFDSSDKLFKDYQIPLEREILDMKLIQKDTKTEKRCIFKKNFVNDNNLSKEAKLLRKAFEIEALKQSKDINSDNFWSTVDQKEFIMYGKNTELCKKEQFPNDFISDDDIKIFFKKLVFAVKQPDEQKLGEIIEARIFDSLDDFKDNIDAEVIYDYVLKQMLNWLKSRESTALSNKDDFFKEGREKVKEIRFHIPHLMYTSCIKNLNIIFNSESNKIQELYNLLDSKNVFNLISSEKNIPLSQAKIYHKLRQSGWYLEDLLNLKKFQNFKVISLFENNRLIIVCRHESENKRNEIEELYNELADYITETHNNKIILITQTDSILASYCKENNLKNNYEQMLDMTTIEDLDQKCLLEKLSNKTITFQGQEKMLPQLINIEKERLINQFAIEDMHKLERILNSDTLSELLLDTNITIGNKLPDIRDPNSPYYDPYHIDIRRTFSYQIIDRSSLKECIKERKEDLFAFSLTNKDYIVSDILDGEKDKIKDFKDNATNYSDKKLFGERYIILDEEYPEKCFKELCNNNNEKTVHWLKYIDNHNFTVEYSNNLFNLRKFIKMENIGSEIKNSSVVIIFGAAGVGKSTVLTKYSQELNPVSEWLLRIDLKDHQGYMKNATFDNLEGIVNFLCQSNLVSLQTALAQNLLKYYLEYPGQIVLLLDGFDKIEDDNKEKLIQLLKFFKNTKRKIWLTTRLHEQHKIENALETFTSSYFLNPFDKKKQEEFLNQYWIKKIKIEELEQDKINNIANFTREHYFHNLGLVKDGGLIGIVLQARMVADIIHSKLKFNSSEIGINNILDLYEKFAELQYKSFMRNMESDKYSQIILINSYTEAHGYLALNALLSEDQSYKELLKNQEFFTRKKSEEFPQNVLSRIGFIVKFRNSYIADFVHPTYAEYFLAKLYVNILGQLGEKTDYPEYKLIREIFLKKIFLDRCSLLRTFLEQEIQKKSNNDKIKNKWKEIQECDLLGEIKTKRALRFLNLSSIRDSNTTTEIQHDDNNILRELKKSWKSYINKWIHEFSFGCISPSKYRFDHDVSIIKNFFQQFFKVTNIEELQSSLHFLIKHNDSIKIIYYVDNELQFLLKDNYNNAIKHQLTQIKLQNIPNAEFDWNKNIFNLDINKQDIQIFMHMLEKLIEARNSTNESEKKWHLEKLLYLLLPKQRHSISDLRKLNNNIYFLFYTSKKSMIKDINSFSYTQIKYKDRILRFLEDMISDVHKINLNETLENVGVKYLQRFFIDITHHSDIIADTILSINEIYQQQKNNFNWIAREGILIFKLLNILTPEISTIFKSVLEHFPSLDRNYIENYPRSVLHNFIYIIDILKTKKLSQIDMLAFLKTIIHFVNIFIETNFLQYLPFTLNQLERILNLLQNILNKQQKPVLEIKECVEFLFTLKKAGLSLINIADQKILILDPISEFQFELSSSYKDQIIELIKKGKIRK